MLVGLPASGKSTWREKFTDLNQSAFVYSTDDMVEAYASLDGSTYDETFKRVIDGVTGNMNVWLSTVIARKQWAIWDQTNLTVNSRRKKLARFGNDYFKTAVYFPVIDVVQWINRLQRPGKTIPVDVLLKMSADLVPPTLDEGFDAIIEIDTFQ